MSFLRLSLLAILLVGGTGCDGYSKVSGVVVDGDGVPVVEAHVEVALEGYRVGIGVTTDSAGAFHERGCHEGTRHGVFDLVVEKTGYRTDRRRLPVSDANENLRIVLEREPMPLPPQTP